MAEGRKEGGVGGPELEEKEGVGWECLTARELPILHFCVISPSVYFSVVFWIFL